MSNWNGQRRPASQQRVGRFEQLETRLALSGTGWLPLEAPVPLDVDAPAALSVAAGTAVRIDGLSISSDDPLDLLTVVMKVNHGDLNVNASVDGGVSASHIQGNGTDNLTINAPLSAIQTTLLDPDGLYYTNTVNPNGTGALAVLVTDASGDNDAVAVPLTITGPLTVSAAFFEPEPLAEPPLAGSLAIDASSESVGAQVVGRHLFYNNSLRYDVVGGPQGPLANGNDNAIATDKVALLRGAGPATQANISSYDRGINGVMVDLAGIGDHTAITLPEVLDDFEFRVGNNDSPDTWEIAPYPMFVNVRTNIDPSANGPGAMSGADRVEIIWADGAIKQKWLQVRVKATANTGLAEDDVFYFGSQVGNTGVFNTATVARTGTLDMATVQVNGKPMIANIPITNPHDMDKDGRVNAADMVIIQTHGTTVATGLKLIELFNPPAAFLILGPTGTVTDSTPLIDWEDALGAESYTVIISSDPAGQNAYRQYENITESEIVLSDGLPNGFWYSTVIAHGADEQTTPAANSGLSLTIDAPFYYAFLVSQTFSASEISSLQAADEQATLSAFIGNLIPDWNGVDVVYRAILSDATTDARDRFVLDRSIFNRNNQLVAFGDDLWGSEFLHGLNYDENGSLAGSVEVWTGTNADGTRAQVEGNWMTDVGMSTYGNSGATDGELFNAGVGSNQVRRRFYAIGPFF